MGAAVERHAERLGVGDAAAADMIGRFDEYVTPPGGGDAPRRGNAGGTGADDDDVDRGCRGRRRGRGGRTRRKGRGRGEKATSTDFCRSLARHGFRMLATVAQIARTTAFAQTLRLSFGQRRNWP